MTDPDVVVYTQPHCASCSQVERFLEERGVAFTIRDVSQDVRALEEIASRGYMSTPVVKVGARWIGGFKTRQIEEALAELTRPASGA